MKSGRCRGVATDGHQALDLRAPPAAVDALFRKAGVIRVDTIHDLFDVAALVATQPLPRGPRVAVLGNSDALAVLAVDACDEAGLVVASSRSLAPEASAEEFEVELGKVFAAPDVDSVVALFIPPLRTPGLEVAGVLAAASRRAGRTVVSCFLGVPGVPAALRADGDGPGSVPSYETPEDAVRALAAVTRYAQWRATPAGRTVSPSGLDVRGARELVREELAAVVGPTASPEAGTTSGLPPPLAPEPLRRLLACYGIVVWDQQVVDSVEEAVLAADRFGWPVALKATAGHLRHRRELAGVHLDLSGPGELRAAHAALLARHGAEGGPLVVQRMAPVGVATRIGAIQDPLIGPVVSFGLGGAATDLLDDRSYGVPPLSDADLAGLVRGVRAAPLLLGHRGGPAADIDALQDLLARVARLVDDVPEVASLELNPVVAGAVGAAVLAARVRLARSGRPVERGARALTD